MACVLATLRFPPSFGRACANVHRVQHRWDQHRIAEDALVIHQPQIHHPSTTGDPVEGVRNVFPEGHGVPRL
eukprot:1521889-Lingulodinium_polyedra.AAC.1